MKLKPRQGKEIPSIPGASLPPKSPRYSEKEREEILDRLLEGEDEETPDDEFVPQQELINDDS